MTREEFERIKEAEKEHLRALKKLKQTVRGLERQKSVNNALTDLASTTGNILDEHTALVEKLAEETAMQEARFEVALESIESDEAVAQQQALQDEADLAKIEEERQQGRARDLVNQVKIQMGTTDVGGRRSASPKDVRGDNPTTQGPKKDRPTGRRSRDETADATRSGTSAAANDDSIPDKTIGKMRRR
jgi:hypothetical protein